MILLPQKMTWKWRDGERRMATCTFLIRLRHDGKMVTLCVSFTLMTIFDGLTAKMSEFDRIFHQMGHLNYLRFSKEKKSAFFLKTAQFLAFERYFRTKGGLWLLHAILRPPTTVLNKRSPQSDTSEYAKLMKLDEINELSMKMCPWKPRFPIDQRNRHQHLPRLNRFAQCDHCFNRLNLFHLSISLVNILREYFWNAEIGIGALTAPLRCDWQISWRWQINARRNSGKEPWTIRILINYSATSLFGIVARITSSSIELLGRGVSFGLFSSGTQGWQRHWSHLRGGVQNRWALESTSVPLLPLVGLVTNDFISAAPKILLSNGHCSSVRYPRKWSTNTYSPKQLNHIRSEQSHT